jgi:hypothetical protein
MTARGIIEAIGEDIAVQACSAVALYADLPDIDDAETPSEWIDRFGPTVRGSARMALVDLLATMDRVSVTRGSDGTDLLAWSVIGAADTLARRDAVSALMPAYIIDREPATPRVRNRKGSSSPDVRKSRRPDHASRVAMELTHAANDILSSAGVEDHSLLGGQTWCPREITPSLGYIDDDGRAVGPIFNDYVSEGWRKRPVKGRRMYCQTATGEYRWTERTAGDAERKRIVERDDNGQAVGIIDAMPRQQRITRQLTSTGIRNVTEEAAARRKDKARQIKRAARGTDQREGIMAVLRTLNVEGARASYGNWAITLQTEARRKMSPVLMAQRGDATLIGTPRALASAIIATS